VGAQPQRGVGGQDRQAAGGGVQHGGGVAGGEPVAGQQQQHRGGDGGDGERGAEFGVEPGVAGGHAADQVECAPEGVDRGGGVVALGTGVGEAGVEDVEVGDDQPVQPQGGGAGGDPVGGLRAGEVFEQAAGAGELFGQGAGVAPRRPQRRFEVGAGAGAVGGQPGEDFEDAAAGLVGVGPAAVAGDTRPAGRPPWHPSRTAPASHELL
jgi:hypothetical protein